MREKQIIYPERPEVIASEMWHYDDVNFKSSTAYLHINGASPNITNHLSYVTIDVTSGIGSISTDGMIAHVNAGDRVTILPRTPYSYVGDDLTMLVTHEQALHPNFVTFNNQKLAKEQRKILRQQDRRKFGRVAVDELFERIMPNYSAILAADFYIRDMDFKKKPNS